MTVLERLHEKIAEKLEPRTFEMKEYGYSPKRAWVVQLASFKHNPLDLPDPVFECKARDFTNDESANAMLLDRMLGDPDCPVIARLFEDLLTHALVEGNRRIAVRDAFCRCFSIEMEER
jgi:hypothetical protein